MTPTIIKQTTLKCSKITDIGVNLTNDRFNKDLTQTLQRSFEAGVYRHIITGTCLPTSQQALALSLDDTLPCERFATAGFHPHSASENTPESWLQLKQLWQHTKVVAIGETGLDFNRNFSTPQQQLDSFEQHLQAAVDLQLPHQWSAWFQRSDCIYVCVNGVMRTLGSLSNLLSPSHRMALGFGDRARNVGGC